MKVLFLGQRGNLEPWFGDVAFAVGESHRVELYDPETPIGPQLEGAGVVIDQGGGVATRSMVDAAAAACVQLWQVLGTGVDHVDVQYILDRGLPLANTPGLFSSIALAEHGLFLMLYFAKKFPETQRSVREGVFYQPVNDELHGKTLGLVGLGASGRELAKRAHAFGMDIVGVDTLCPPGEILEALGVRFLGGPASLAELLAGSDYVSLHVPLTRRTRHMLDARSLGLMRPGSILINVARGELVDEAALVDALRNSKLRGAGLDVFALEPLDSNSPLLELDNVVLTPHVAGVTTGTSRRRAEAVAENVRRTAAGLAPLYSITEAE